MCSKEILKYKMTETNTIRIIQKQMIVVHDKIATDNNLSKQSILGDY